MYRSLSWVISRCSAALLRCDPETNDIGPILRGQSINGIHMVMHFSVSKGLELHINDVGIDCSKFEDIPVMPILMKRRV
jgi:hypothetical protein